MLCRLLNRRRHVFQHRRVDLLHQSLSRRRVAGGGENPVELLDAPLVRAFASRLLARAIGRGFEVALLRRRDERLGPLRTKRLLGLLQPLRRSESVMRAEAGCTSS